MSYVNTWNRGLINLFSEQLTIMTIFTSDGPSGKIKFWLKGETITAKIQISNMRDVQVANASGVKATGYLCVSNKIATKIKLDTYLYRPKSNNYIHVLDGGVDESGFAIFNERQFAVESVPRLPQA